MGKVFNVVPLKINCCFIKIESRKIMRTCFSLCTDNKQTSNFVLSGLGKILCIFYFQQIV